MRKSFFSGKFLAGVGCFLSVFFLCGESRAEVALVSDFSVTADVVLACDIEEVLAERLEEWGLDVLIRKDANVIPDIVVSGEYWSSGPNVFVTMVITDSVVGKNVAGRHVYIPPDEALCEDAARSFVDSYANPQNVVAHKENIRDTKTGMEFVFIPGGTMVTGKDGARHKGGLESFLMGKFEVTQEQWQKVMGSNPSKFTYAKDLPVENVSWEEAREFIRKFRDITGLDAALPSEAQWEYAARSRGRSFRWSGTNIEAKLGEFCWNCYNSGGTTKPVGTKRANSLGLYDMSGNVWEWCEDSYMPRYKDDPVYEPDKKLRVVRGGSWMSPNTPTLTSARDADDQTSRYSDNGFRLVVKLKK